jgi:hypothetical protein
MDSSQKLKMTFHRFLPIKCFLADEVAAPILKDFLAGLPLVKAFSSGGDEDSFLRMLGDLPVTKLISLNAGAVDEKQLDDLVALINSKIND